MKTLFEIREKIIQIYNKIEVYLIPVLKLIICFIVLHTINSRMGYFEKIDSIPIELIASILCAFLPTGVILLFAALFSMLNLYGLSLIAAIFGGVLYLVVYLLLLRFSPKEALVLAITPVLMLWKIPYILPIILGLVATPASAVGVGCGVVVYYFLKVIVANNATLSSLGVKEALEQVKLIVDAFLKNKEAMIIYIIAFTATIILVYFLKRLSLKRNWEIAIGAGVVLDMIILIIGDVVKNFGLSYVSVILVSILAVAIGIVIKFFRFCVDFGRTENVQFEDDDYYYYVKAVPKINLGIASPKTKKINRRSGRSKYVTGTSEETYEDGIYNDGIYVEDENYEGEYTEEYYEEDGYYEEGESDLLEDGDFSDDKLV